MGKYDDIINLEHHVSKNHPQMSIYDRSAQFAPFAALTGYEESIKKAGEIFDTKIELSEDRIQEINGVINKLLTSKDETRINIVYFHNNKYMEVTETVKKVDLNKKRIQTINNVYINFNDIIDLSIV